MAALTIAVANRKGGSGKTTTAVNLAAGWAAKGYRTLLIDLDTQGHAAIGVGVTTIAPSEQCVHQIFTQHPTDLEPLLCLTEVDDLTLLPADLSFDGSTHCDDWQRLRNHLRQASLQDRFDRIVIDTAPGQDIALYNALAAADGVLIPCTMHHLTSIGVRQLANLIYKVSMEVHNPLKLFGLLPVMTSPRERMHRRVKEQFSQRFGAMRLMSGIRRDIRLAEAFEKGLPIFDAAPKSRGAEDYRVMIKELEAMIAQSSAK